MWVLNLGYKINSLNFKTQNLFVKIVKEPVISEFDGTIIDLETIGNFTNEYEDSRRYSKIRPVFFGYITKKGIEIHCAEKKADIEELLSNIQKIIPALPRPFHAFNTPFEMGVLFHSLTEKVVFERELNKKVFEKKLFAVQDLRLSNYNDPFHDRGELFPPSWEKGNMKDCIAHNRADLLKEKDILLKRGFRQPDEFKFVNES